MKIKKIVAMLLFLGSNMMIGQAYALPTEGACALMSEKLNAAAQQYHLKDIAILPFIANGRMSSDISEEMRDLSLEKLSEYSAIDIFDRNEMQLVATESSISCPEGMANTASSFLVTEIFYAEGDPVGYMSYRLIQTSDSRVLASGFIKLDWDESQRGLLSGANRALKSGQLPLIPEKEEETVVAKTESIQDNIAIVYDGSDSKDNTLAARMAFAQIQTWLIEKGHAVFEREFFRSVAAEQSLNDDVANSGDNISTVGHIKMKKKDDSSNRVTVQFFSLLNHKNLATFSLIQNVTSEAVGNMQGDDGENALALRRKNRLQAQKEAVSGVEFVQHYEYVFSENELIKIERYVDAYSDEVQLRHPDWDENNQLAYIKASVYNKIWKSISEKLKEDITKKFKANNFLLMNGYVPDIMPYDGPARIKAKLEEFSSGDSFYELRYPGQCLPGKVAIKSSVDWKNGVPFKITIDMDFSKDEDKLKRLIGAKTSKN